MQISVETTAGLERRMQIQVPAERIAQEIDERLKSMSRTVKLKGFRPGKVPVKVVRQQFGPQVREEVLHKLLQSTFTEAVELQKLSPATGPRIESLDAPEGADLKYSAVFEVFPEVQLRDLSDVTVEKDVAEITEQDLDAMIENLRKQGAKFLAVEREARATDRITVDFEGSIDGQPFEGGKGENVPIVLGAGRMLKDFEAGLMGSKAGEEKAVNVAFPADYPAANLAGKTAVFAIKTRVVEEQQLPEIDDEFVKAYGIEEGGLARLREEVADNMRL
jgi:trigger factor